MTCLAACKNIAGTWLEKMLTRAVSGVISEGFITMVQPHASAGATFHDLQARGEMRLRLTVAGYIPHVDRVVPGDSVEATVSGQI